MGLTKKTQTVTPERFYRESSAQMSYPHASGGYPELVHSSGFPAYTFVPAGRPIEAFGNDTDPF
jgi:hypothetical protein